MILKSVLFSLTLSSSILMAADDIQHHVDPKPTAMGVVVLEKGYETEDETVRVLKTNILSVRMHSPTKKPPLSPIEVPAAPDGVGKCKRVADPTEIPPTVNFPYRFVEFIEDKPSKSS